MHRFPEIHVDRLQKNIVVSPSMDHAWGSGPDSHEISLVRIRDLGVEPCGCEASRTVMAHMDDHSDIQCISHLELPTTDSTSDDIHAAFTPTLNIDHWGGSSLDDADIQKSGDAYGPLPLFWGRTREMRCRLNAVLWLFLRGRHGRHMARWRVTAVGSRGGSTVVRFLPTERLKAKVYHGCTCVIVVVREHTHTSCPPADNGLGRRRRRRRRTTTNRCHPLSPPYVLPSVGRK
ncbi:hypothetical protein BDY19DRAFT_411879 [Irpex rosettiformis]|uniref:Uncharacterized protein n=1 Tax=Irpex rosettiformis TaxID=378272 RepID=A0ACB8UFX2_9APHY|nr:hypothetical protein BDY19DRAFT_411879 [Irpex rosettiformis]